ncbi:MAG TPA: dienelactone hydrolase family protein [Gemmatimonadales bacterium]|nr:dienelactone hydrolase family protein [Gemmatimonadales bacterium]
MTRRDLPLLEAGTVALAVGSGTLEGDLIVPEGASGVVLFAHGSGSSRLSPRNRFVAGVLEDGGLATFLVDLLTPAEERADEATAELRFDIGLLADRLVGAIDWLRGHGATRELPIGLFGASTGAAAALVAAARRAGAVGAVVSRGGRPDLALEALDDVRAPTLLIVGGDDWPVIPLNRQAYDRLRAVKAMEIVPGASHLFEEPGTLARVAELARTWFIRHLGSPGTAAGGATR